MLKLKILAYLELTRPIICVSAFIMAIVGYWLSIHQFDFSNVNAYWAALSVSTAMAFANVLNDVYDVKGDRVNYPDRPIPAGIVTISEGIGLTAFYLVVSLASGFVVGWRMFTFTIFLLLGSVAYDLWANKVPILGKAIVATLCASTLATGYFVTAEGELPILPVLTAFLFILARELIETISDDAGDSVAGRGSIYTLWGKARVLQIVSALIIISVILLLVPLFTIDLASRLLYLLTIVVLLFFPVGLAALAIWKDQSPINIRNVAQWVGVVFFSSVVAFLWLV